MFTKAKHYAFKCKDPLRIDSTGAGWGISINFHAQLTKGKAQKIA